MRNAGLKEAQARIKIAGKVKEESEKHSENEDHGIWSHHFMGNRWGNFGGAPKSLQMVIAAMKFKDTYSLEGKL